VVKNRTTPKVDADLNLLSNRVIAAALEVHRALGPGLLEQIYESALCVELELKQIQFERQAENSLTYKGVRVGRGYADLLIDRRLVVEIKASDALHDRHLAQTLSYLRATGYQLGLLLNFNVAVLRHGIRRVALTR